MFVTSISSLDEACRRFGYSVVFAWATAEHRWCIGIRCRAQNQMKRVPDETGATGKAQPFDIGMGDHVGAVYNSLLRLGAIASAKGEMGKRLRPECGSKVRGPC